MATVLVTWPLVRCLGACLGRPPDTLASIYFLHWVAHALTTSGVRVLDAPMFAPYHDTLTVGEYLPAYAPLAIPALRFTRNPVLAHNAVLLAQYWAAALGATVLARRIAGATAPAIVAGVAFAFSPRLLDQAYSLQTLSIAWVPWLFLAAERFVARPTVATAALAALLGLGLGLSSMNLFVFALLGLAVFALVGWTSGTREITRRHLFPGAVVCLPAAGVLAVYVAPYQAAARRWGLGRSLIQVTQGATTLSDYLALPPEPLLRRLAGGMPLSPVAGLCLGVTVSVLALVALRAAWGTPSPTRRALWPYLGMALVAVVLAAGPRLATPWGDVPMPYLVLYVLVPGIDAIRTPARLLLLVDLVVALLAAVGVASLLRRTPARRRAAALGGVLAVILVESIVVPFPGAVPRLDPTRLPRVYQWLATEPSTTVALGVPMGDWVNVAAVAFHLRRTVNGWASWDPPRYAELVAAMESFPDARSLALVRGLRPDVVLVDRTWLDPRRAAALEAGGSGLRLAATFDTHLVYRLDASTAAGIETATVRVTPPVGGGSGGGPGGGAPAASFCVELQNPGPDWLPLYPVRTLRLRAEQGGPPRVSESWLPLDLGPGARHRACLASPGGAGPWRLVGEVRSAGRMAHFVAEGRGDGAPVAAPIRPGLP